MSKQQVNATETNETTEPAGASPRDDDSNAANYHHTQSTATAAAAPLVETSTHQPPLPPPPTSLWVSRRGGRAPLHVQTNAIPPPTMPLVTPSTTSALASSQPGGVLQQPYFFNNYEYSPLSPYSNIVRGLVPRDSHTLAPSWLGTTNNNNNQTTTLPSLSRSTDASAAAPSLPPPVPTTQSSVPTLLRTHTSHTGALEAGIPIETQLQLVASSHASLVVPQCNVPAASEPVDKRSSKEEDYNTQQTQRAATFRETKRRRRRRTAPLDHEDDKTRPDGSFEHQYSLVSDSLSTTTSSSTRQASIRRRRRPLADLGMGTSDRNDIATQTGRNRAPMLNEHQQPRDDDEHVTGEHKEATEKQCTTSRVSSGQSRKRRKKMPSLVGPTRQEEEEEATH